MPAVTFLFQPTPLAFYTSHHTRTYKINEQALERYTRYACWYYLAAKNTPKGQILRADSVDQRVANLIFSAKIENKAFVSSFLRNYYATIPS